MTIASSLSRSPVTRAFFGRVRAFGATVDRAADETVFAWCLGALVVAITAFLIVPLTPLFSVLNRVPTYHDWVIEPKPQGLVTPYWLLSTGGFVVAVWLWRRGRRPSWRLVVAGTLLLTVLALLVPPVASTDIYTYSFYGVAQAQYHQNPYLAFPYQHVLNPWFPFWSWRFSSAVYGPPFLWLLRGLAVLAGGSMLAWVIEVKLVLTFAVLLGIWLLARALTPNGDGRWAVLLVGWNPMVLQAVAMSGHVDALLLPLLAGAVLAHRRGHHFVAFLLLVGGFLIKLYLGPLGALYALWFTRRVRPGRRVVTFVGLGVVGTAITAVVYLPFFGPGPKIFASLLFVGNHFIADSPAAVVRRVLVVVFSVTPMGPGDASIVAAQVTQSLSMVAILVAFGVAVARLDPRKDPWEPMTAWFAAFLLCSTWAFSWYAVPLAGLVAVIEWGTTARVSLTLGLTLVPMTVQDPGAAAAVGPPLTALGGAVVGTLERYGVALALFFLGRRGSSSQFERRRPQRPIAPSEAPHRPPTAARDDALR